MLASDQNYTPLGVSVLQTLSVLYGVWNLDFFRTILNGVCLNVSTLQVLALDYLVAVYPMLVMAIAYVLVELHGYGFRPVLYMWRPFHCFFARFRRQWNIQHSIMDTFVTFFILSTTKFLSVSFDLLIPTMLYTPDGTPIGLYLYYDASLQYFHGHHLPYALLALTVLSVFILLPLTLLTLYPWRLFRKCLMKCKLHNTTLISFVHTFQQYYKDGRNGTMDCRWFAGFYFVVRIGIFFNYGLILSALAYIFTIILFALMAVLLLVAEPYKREYAFFNILDFLVMLWQAIVSTLIVFLNFSTLMYKAYVKSSIILLGIVGFMPLLHFVILLIRWIYRWSKLSTHHGIIFPCHQNTTEDDLPDRVSNPDGYRDSFGFVRAITK